MQSHRRYGITRGNPGSSGDDLRPRIEDSADIMTPENAPVQKTSAKRLLRVLRGEPVDRPPFWFMRQAGRYLPEYRDLRTQADGFLNLCYSPKMACEVTLQPIRRYGMDAAILFSDILVVPHALGQAVSFVAGEGPKLEPVRKDADLLRLSLENIDSHLSPIYETVERVAAALPAETALIGFAGAPWTVATYMVEGGSSKDFSAVKAFAYRDPAAFDRLIAMLTEATAKYLCRQVDAGAEVIQLFDTWAGVLPPEGLDRWVIEPTRVLVDRLRSHRPDIPVIGFPRQIGAQLPRFVRETGLNGVSLDTGVDLDLAEKLQASTVVQGNLDPILLTVGGPTMIDAATRRLDRLGRGSYIFNLGHGITPSADVKAVGELSELIRNWSSR
jgi:uroporphyrinogen decarboxylase